jgi:hypothetical protein
MAKTVADLLIERLIDVVQAVVDANEPPMPGHVTTEQAVKFAEALIKGQRKRFDIIKTVLEDTVREVV